MPVSRRRAFSDPGWFRSALLCTFVAIAIIVGIFRHAVKLLQIVHFLLLIALHSSPSALELFLIAHSSLKILIFHLADHAWVAPLAQLPLFQDSSTCLVHDIKLGHHFLHPLHEFCAPH